MVDDDDILPPERSVTIPKNTGRATAVYEPLMQPASGDPISRFFDRQKRKSVQERRQLVDELRLLVQSFDALHQDVVNHEKTLGQIRRLPEILAADDRKLMRRLEHDESIFLTSLSIEHKKLLLQELEVELQLHEVQEKLERLRNPPPPPGRQNRRDPKLDDLDAALSGGGKYSQYVEEQVEALVRKRGGKEHLTEEDKEQIRNAYRKAAGHDEGRG